jgi:acetate CoA/acetoacetate CoA-transferase alpha subunit
MKGALKPEAAAAMIPQGAGLMIGGFMAVGTPERMIDAIVARGVGGLPHQGNRI